MLGGGGSCLKPSGHPPNSGSAVTSRFAGIHMAKALVPLYESPTTHPQRALRHKSLVPPCFVNQLLDRFAWSVNDRSRSNVSSFDGRHAQEKGRRPSR